MARSEITALAAPGPNASAGVAFTLDDCDAVNYDYTVHRGHKLLVLAYNANAGAQTVTVQSKACSHGRTQDQTLSIPASNYAVFGPFDIDWANGGNLEYDAGHADIDYKIIELP